MGLGAPHRRPDAIWFVKQMKDLENIRLTLQKELDATKTQAERNRHGQFATPTELAMDMISVVLSLLPKNSKIRFLEPGFGTGAFYSALLRQVPTSRIKSAAAFELDPVYANSAEALWQKTGLRLNKTDFTTATPPHTDDGKYNLVICNPPYVRHHHLSLNQKLELKDRVTSFLNFEMNGLSGLYAYFLVLSKAWMKNNGIGMWLIPSEFMDVNYGQKLKQFLTEKVTLLRVHRFDPKEVQFGDALVSSAVVIFSNSLPSIQTQVEFTFGGTLRKPRNSCSKAIGELRKIKKWANLEKTTSNKESLATVTLGDLFIIKRGLATGCNSFFILTIDQVRKLNLPWEFLKPILPRPKELESDRILEMNGKSKILRYLLSCDLPPSEIEKRHSSLWKYLEHGMELGIHQRYLCNHREPWYSQEERPPSPFLCSYMGRQNREGKSPFHFYLNESQATAPNVYLMLYPRAHIASIVASNTDTREKVWKALASIEKDTLHKEGRTYGGGLLKLEPRELANVPADTLIGIFPEVLSMKKETQLLLGD